jgi:hypothetical protein
MQGQQFRTVLADRPHETHSMRETELFRTAELDHSLQRFVDWSSAVWRQSTNRRSKRVTSHRPG